MLLTNRAKNMCSVKDVNQQDFVIAFAAHLKKAGKLKVPEWSEIVKTGIHKELAPCDADWYYIRCASILRRVYMDNGLGIKSLARIYGGRKRRGTKPAHFSFGSHSVARKALQSLEGIKLIVKDERGGRRITPQGQRDADRIAGQVAKRSPAAE